jgi:hypothetical protein
VTQTAPTAPEGWVPVEHRFAGLDRRTFPPALTALAVALVLIYGLQALSGAIPWHNEIKAGDVLDLGAGATAVPPVGWELEEGTLTGADQASPANLEVLLASGGATIQMRGTTFPGSAAAFLDQVQRAQSGKPAAVSATRGSITTNAGLTGVVQSRSGPGGDELQAAFKMATGPAAVIQAAPALLVEVRTAPGQGEQFQNVVTAFLRSITPETTR